MNYFFILGKNPNLSVAEIISKQNFEIINFSDEVLVVKSSKKLEKDFIDQLGGTVKFGEIFNINDFDAEFLIDKIITKKATKIFWGASFYKLNNQVANKKIFNTQKAYQKKFFEIKKILKQKNISSRFVTSQKPDLSSVIVAKNKILETGAEICVFISHEKILFGQTLAVQNFEEYGFFDYQRPSKDLKSGMLPPKVAKILINLCNVPQNKMLLDPFCGSGTILSQALLMGYKNVFGSDLSKKAINDSLNNLTWLKKNFELKNTAQIRICNATNLIFCFIKEKFDAVATEPFLGAPLSGRENALFLKKSVQELSLLYINTFKSLKKILNKNAVVAIIFPVFVSKNQKFYLPILNDIKKLGFAQKKWDRAIKTNLRGGLDYFREGQKVQREVYVFKQL